MYLSPKICWKQLQICKYTLYRPLKNTRLPWLRNTHYKNNSAAAPLQNAGTNGEIADKVKREKSITSMFSTIQLVYLFALLPLWQNILCDRIIREIHHTSISNQIILGQTPFFAKSQFSIRIITVYLSLCINCQITSVYVYIHIYKCHPTKRVEWLKPSPTLKHPIYQPSHSE